MEGLKMRTLEVAGIVICLLMLSGFSSVTALASDGFIAAAEKTATEKKIEKAAATPAAGAAKSGEKLTELSLNDVQDAGLLLDFIQEQCINVYEEASRVPVSTNSTPDIKQLNKIPVQLNTKTFLPPRQEWLVFFVGTVEPVIRQFGQMVTDIDAGTKQVVIPDPIAKSMSPLFDEWEKDTKELNHHLDQLVPLFDDAPNQSEKIRDLAVACYDDAGRMETVRRKIFSVLQKNAKQGGEKVLMSPE